MSKHEDMVSKNPATLPTNFQLKFPTLILPEKWTAG